MQTGFHAGAPAPIINKKIPASDVMVGDVLQMREHQRDASTMRAVVCEAPNVVGNFLLIKTISLSPEHSVEKLMEFAMPRGATVQLMLRA